MIVRELISLLEQEDQNKTVKVLEDGEYFDVGEVGTARVFSQYDQDFDYSIVVLKTE